MRTISTALLAFGFLASLPAAAQEPRIVKLKEAKLNIEHNATDEDTGFQGFIDSEGWKELKVKGPDGVVLHLEADGKLRKLGMTELFFETVEPENADVSIDKMLAKMPAGTYKIYGAAGGPDTGKETVGFAKLTHVIPRGPVLTAPANGITVAPGDLTFDWEPVTLTIKNQPVEIIAYQLIVEKDTEPHKHMIGKEGSLSMYLPPTVTAMTIPAAFFEAATEYKWEVLAIEPSGNQTLSEAGFTTP